MATETATNKGLTISFDDGDFSTGTVSVLLDLDLRTGTPVDETGWLDGNAGGDYPGSLTGFWLTLLNKYWLSAQVLQRL
jgi:hypothetical protein